MNEISIEHIIAANVKLENKGILREDIPALMI
jgi:hypothetical protein